MIRSCTSLVSEWECGIVMIHHVGCVYTWIPFLTANGSSRIILPLLLFYSYHLYLLHLPLHLSLHATPILHYSLVGLFTTRCQVPLPLLYNFFSFSARAGLLHRMKLSKISALDKSRTDQGCKLILYLY